MGIVTILPFLGLILVGVVLLTVLRQTRPELAVLLSATVGIVVLITIMGKLGLVIQQLQGLTNRAGLEPFYLQTVLKVMGVAFLTGFGAQLCRDSGEGALAMKLEFAGKVIILIIAIPVVSSILQLLLRVL